MIDATTSIVNQYRQITVLKLTNAKEVGFKFWNVKYLSDDHNSSIYFHSNVAFPYDIQFGVIFQLNIVPK